MGCADHAVQAALQLWRTLLSAVLGALAQQCWVLVVSRQASGSELGGGLPTLQSEACHCFGGRLMSGFTTASAVLFVSQVPLKDLYVAVDGQPARVTDVLYL